MLHGLAGFIFGKSPSSEAVEEAANPAGRENNENANDVKIAIKPMTPVLLKNESLEIVDGDDEEWLMVDVRRDENVSSELAAAMSAPVELDLALPSSNDASSGESSPSVDERGWNLTPPPVFTASFQREKRMAMATLPDTNEEKIVGIAKNSGFRGGDDNEALNAVLETSNFENLLIEHPSMSVYGRIMPHDAPRRRQVASAIAVTQGIDQLQNAIAPLPPSPPNEKTEEAATIANVVRRRQPANVAEALLGIELSMATSRQADLGKQQRAECAYKAKDLGANRMRRLNAVAMVPPQGSASPRKRRMKNHPAGRCNDRKCQ